MKPKGGYIAIFTSYHYQMWVWVDSSLSILQYLSINTSVSQYQYYQYFSIVANFIWACLRYANFIIINYFVYIIHITITSSDTYFGWTSISRELLWFF